MTASPRVIPAQEQRWLAESFVDPNGRVFEWQGGIYRMLEPAYAKRWQALTEDGVIAKLINDGLLVESEMSGITTESGNAVLQHRRIPVVSYCYEWVPAMLRDAALLTLDLCIRLAEKGLTIQDGHPWNILFDGTKPVYIDASSIVPVRDDILWAPYQQFCNFFLFPLYLFAAGRDHLARWLMRDYTDGVSDDDLLAGTSLSFQLRHPRRTLGVILPKVVGKLFERLPDHLQERFVAISKSATVGGRQARLRIKFFESLRENFATLRLPSGTSPWSRYYRTTDKEYFQTELSPQDWRRKNESVERILADVQPSSVLDVGANTGNYSRIAAANAARVTACEIDIAALTRCYDGARRDGLNILSLAANVFSTSPTPGRGGIACAAPVERLRSDLVMGLAVIHHAVAVQRIPIARVCDIFTALTERWLLLEYAAPLKPKIGAAIVPDLDDYTVNDLESCLRARFREVSCLPSFPEDRKLFLCAK